MGYVKGANRVPFKPNEDELKRRAAAKGYKTLYDLSIDCGYSKTALSGWIRNGSISPNDLETLCDYLGCKYEDLCIPENPKDDSEQLTFEVITLEKLYNALDENNVLQMMINDRLSIIIKGLGLNDIEI